MHSKWQLLLHQGREHCSSQANLTFSENIRTANDPSTRNRAVMSIKLSRRRKNTASSLQTYKSITLHSCDWPPRLPLFFRGLSKQTWQAGLKSHSEPTTTVVIHCDYLVVTVFYIICLPKAVFSSGLAQVYFEFSFVVFVSIVETYGKTWH